MAELTLQNVTLHPGNDSFECEISFDFDLLNITSQTMLVAVRLSQFTLTDNLGDIWQPTAMDSYEGCPVHDDVYSYAVDPGKRFGGGGYTGWYVGFAGNTLDPSVVDMNIRVDGLYHFNGATWHVHLNK